MVKVPPPPIHLQVFGFTKCVEPVQLNTIGASASNTVTLNEQLDEPTGLVAVAVTVVVPTGKRLPGAIE